MQNLHRDEAALGPDLLEKDLNTPSAVATAAHGTRNEEVPKVDTLLVRSKQRISGCRRDLLKENRSILRV